MKFDLQRYHCLGEAIREHGIGLKSRLACVEVDREEERGRWTHQEVHREAERFGALLQAHGFKAGDFCAILLSNQSKWIFSALGVFWSGGVVVPLDYKLTAVEQAGLLRHCGAKFLVVEYHLWKRLAEGESKALDGLEVFVTEAPDGAELGQFRRWEERPGRAFHLRGRNRGDVATIVYSSGTGGQAKGCVLTHEAYLRQVEQLGNIVQPSAEDRYLSIIPTNHAIDFMCGFVIPLLSGTQVIHQRTLRSQFLMSTMKKYRVTLIALVPLLLKAIKAAIEEKVRKEPGWKQELFRKGSEFGKLFPNPTLHRFLNHTVFKPVHDQFGGELRLIIAGGAFVDPQVADFFYGIGIPVAIGYGLTEAGTAVTLNDLHPYRGDTVGKPVPGTEVEIRDPNEQGIGEVWVRGPSLMKEYFHDPEQTAEVIVDHWLRSGDLGSIDASGHLKLVGRSKNMIVTEGGKNIYPEDIEKTFEELTECEEYCVFAHNFIWPSGKLGEEKLTLVLRPKPKADTPSLEEDVRRKNRQLADYKRIHEVLFWPGEFPRTATMKIKRQQLAMEIRQSAAEQTEAHLL